jgi:hypothetical protein
MARSARAVTQRLSRLPHSQIRTSRAKAAQSNEETPYPRPLTGRISGDWPAIRAITRLAGDHPRLAFVIVAPMISIESDRWRNDH